jgi:ABC-type glycerol-3-phosphate transport system substrate-binding protein
MDIHRAFGENTIRNYTFRNYTYGFHCLHKFLVVIEFEKAITGPIPRPSHASCLTFVPVPNIVKVITEKEHAMKNFTRRFVAPLMILGALLLLTACGFFGAAATPTPPPPPVELSLVNFNVLGSLEPALIQAFEAGHPNLKIKLSEYRQEPTNYLTSPAPPDILMLAPGEQLDAAISQNLLTDLTDVWQRADLANSYPAAFRPLSERDGKQFLLPLAYTWNAIYYNKQVFAQYNLQPPTTWDELMQLCDTLVSNGETPFSISGRDPFMAALWIDYLDLRLNGVEFHQQLSTGQVSYDKEARVRTLFETWRSLVDRGYFLTDARSMDDLASLMTLVRNEKIKLNESKAVMALSGPLFLNNLPEPLRSELDFFPFPAIDPTQPGAEAVFAIGYVIPASAAHRLEAIEFLTFLNSAEGRAIIQKDVNSAHLYIPAFAKADTPGLPADVKQGMNLVQSAHDLAVPYGVNVPQSMFFAIDNLVRQVVFESTEGKPFDLDAALQKMEAARAQTTGKQ